MAALSRFEIAWRISTSATLTNKHFYCYKLPVPANGRGTWKYTEYSERVPQSQGGLATQGYINLSIVWVAMDFSQIKTLRDLVTTCTAAGTPLYLTVPRNNAEGLAEQFIDIYGTPHLPEFNQVEGSRGRAFNGVTLMVNNITVVGLAAV